MVEFTANGKLPGDTIVLAGPGDVRVQAKADARAPLSKIEVLHNGVGAAEGLVESSARSATLDQTVRIEKSGWLGARVYGTGGAQAHTSPIYVEVAGQAASSKADAAYFLEWIDRLEARFTAADRCPQSRAARVREGTAGRSPRGVSESGAIMAIIRSRKSSPSREPDST